MGGYRYTQVFGACQKYLDRGSKNSIAHIPGGFYLRLDITI